MRTDQVRNITGLPLVEPVPYFSLIGQFYRAVIAGKLMWIDVFYHVNFAFQLSGKICEQNLTACWAVNSEACGELCPASNWLMGATPAFSLAADTLTPLTASQSVRINKQTIRNLILLSAQQTRALWDQSTGCKGGHYWTKKSLIICVPTPSMKL